MMIGLIDPIFATIKPEVGPNIRRTIAKGNCTYPASAASNPKPKGCGFLTSTGIVWNTMNIEKPTTSIMMLLGSIALCKISLKSTRGYFSLLSIITKSANVETPSIIK
jgi:Zn-dependent alcohol dehydrogenase